MLRVGTTEKDSPRRRTESHDSGSMSAVWRSDAEEFSLVWQPSVITPNRERFHSPSAIGNGSMLTAAHHEASSP